MNLDLKGLLSLPVLILGLIFSSLQDFGLNYDLNKEDLEVGLADFKPPRDR